MDYLIPGVIGFLTGGVLFGLSYQSIFLKISTIASYGQQTLADLLHVNHWIFVLLFGLCTLVFYVASKITEQAAATNQAEHGMNASKEA